MAWQQLHLFSGVNLLCASILWPVIGLPGKWQVHFVDRSLGIMTWQQLHLFIGDRVNSVCLFCDQLLACNVNMGYKSIINLNPIQSLLLFGRNHILCNWNVIENYLLILANLHLVRRCATIKWKRKRLLPGSKTLNSFKSQIYFAIQLRLKDWTTELESHTKSVGPSNTKTRHVTNWTTYWLILQAFIHCIKHYILYVRILPYKIPTLNKQQSKVYANLTAVKLTFSSKHQTISSKLKPFLWQKQNASPISWNAENIE
jgi:hypothetical protein